MIKIENVRKRYPSEPADVLKEISFQVAEGQRVALMGPSGSGKTTVLNILGGLDSDYTGKVMVNGQNLGEMEDRELSRYRNQTVGFVFQNFQLLEHLSVADNVLLPARFSKQRLTAADLGVRVEECLQSVGLLHKLQQSPRNLSGGERQRVAIARALLLEPKLLLCDEPTGALDTENSQQILELFQKLNETRGVTILLVTHSEQVGETCEHILRMRDGKMEQTA